jgi:MFS family permease
MAVGQAISFTGGGIGLCLGLVLSGLATEAWGWRATFILLSLPSFLAAAAVWRFIREPASVARQGWAWRPYRALLRSTDLWRLYLAQATNIYAMSVIGTWAPAMFQEVGVEGLGASSLYASLLGLAALPGLLLVGWGSDRTASRGLGRKGVLALAYAGVAAALLGLGIALSVRLPAAALGAGIFLAGVFLWGCYGPAYAVLGDLAPPEVLGTAFGLCNTVAFVGSLVAPMATGWIRDVTGSFAGGCYVAAGLALVGAFLAFSIPPAFRLAPEGARAGSG